MYLTREEEKMLEGERGEAARKALEIVVKVGEALGAEKLVKISSAHVSGVSYVNIGEAGLELIRDLALSGARFTVLTTVNPTAIDTEKWREMGIPQEIALKQLDILKHLELMGAQMTLTCTPYLLHPPAEGEQIAWGESNAVLYANSVLGARTNREGGPLVLFEAISGRAPYVGLRREEERRPTLLVEVDEDVRERLRNGVYSYPMIGYTLGLKVGRGVPFLNFKIPFEEVKGFLAAVGASSSIGLVLIKGVSPEAEKYTEVLNELEEIHIDTEDVETACSKISADYEEADAVFLGCPHLSPRELEEILSVIAEKGELKRRTILSTSRWALERVHRSKEELSDKVIALADTCIVVAPIEYMGLKKVITDSAKAAYYLSSKGVKTTVLPRKKILEEIL